MYKNSTREGDDDDKEEEVDIDCEGEINNFLPLYYKATTTFSDGKDDFDLALYHYISSGSSNGPIFEQFVLRQQLIEKNDGVDNNNLESSTVTETIADMCLVNKLKKNTWFHFRNEQLE